MESSDAFPTERKSCKFCGQDAVFSALSQMYQNEDFCEKCYDEVISSRSNDYIMIIDLRKQEIIERRTIVKTSVERSDVLDQSPELLDLYKDIKKYIR